MKTQKLLKTVSLVLIAVILMSSVLMLGVSAANCAHSTERALLHNSGGFTIANLCKTCGETVRVVGHVDSSKSINTYKASDYAEVYTDKQLSAGFSAAMGNALYVEDNVISKGGEPYWLIFDMMVGALRVITVTWLHLTTILHGLPIPCLSRIFRTGLTDPSLSQSGTQREWTLAQRKASLPISRAQDGQ